MHQPSGEAAQVEFGAKHRSAMILVCLFLLAGCCDKRAIDKCRAEAQSRLKLLEQETIESRGLMRFEVRRIADAKIAVDVLKASCVSGKRGAAEVKIDWKIAAPSVRGVRVRVGAGNNADKVWVETGPEGNGVTGPWIQDGALIELHDSYAGGLLGEIRVVGLPCGGT